MIEIMAILKEHRHLFGGGVLICLMTACYVWGVSNGRVPHVVECSEELISNERLARERDDLLGKLARCNVSHKGAAILDADAQCAERIKKALAEAKAWACED